MIPQILWQPHVINERFKETKQIESNPNPFRSSYQADFDSPSLLSLNSSKNYSGQVNENKSRFNNLNELNKRKNEIDQALLKLNS